MRYDTIEALMNRAMQVYGQDTGFVNLRAQIEKRLQVRHRTYDVPNLPATVKKLLKERYRRPGLAAEKLERAMSMLSDPQGIQFNYTRNSLSNKGKEQREAMQDWMNAAWQIAGYAYGENRETQADESLLLHSLCAFRIQPSLHHLARAAKRAPGVFKLPDGPVPMREATRLAGTYLAETKAAKVEQDQALHQLPFCIVNLDTKGLWFRVDAHGRPEEVLEFRSETVAAVLSTYRNSEDQPLAKRLAAEVGSDHGLLTTNDRVTVVIRADADDLQIGIVDFHPDTLTGDLGAVTGYGTAELLFSGPHGLGRLPYAIGFGRITGAEEPWQHFNGFLDPILDDEIALARVLTQRAFIIDTGAWPGVEITRHERLAEFGSFGDEQPGQFTYVPGGVHDNLAPGERLEPIKWWEPHVLQPLDQEERVLRADMDRKTFGAPAYGPVAGTDSGYQQNLIQTADRSPLEVFLTGKRHFYADVAALMQACALRVIRLVGQPLVLRMAAGDRFAELKLTEDLAAQTWDVEAQIQPEPVGGRLAWTQTIKAAEEAGYLSHDEAMRLYGNRSPERTLVQIASDKLLTSPQVQQALEQLVIGQFVARLAAPDAPGMPNRTLLPPVYAQMLQQMAPDSPQLAGLPPLPGGPPPGGPPALSPRNAGLPAPVDNITQPPGPAPMSPTRLPGAPQGNRAGQAQPLPGGLARLAGVQGPPV